jgi:isopenicillin N synthase-like dioxygenase
MKVRTVDFRDPQAGRKFTDSFRETGFAVVSNHPVDARLITDTFGEWAQFFAGEGKHAYTFDPVKQAGYFPFRSENAKDSAKKDLKEFYHYYPSRSELPREASTFTTKLYAELSQMGLQLLKWIDAHTPDDIRRQFSMPLDRMVQGSAETLLRPIHYPPLQGSEEEGAVRAAAHEDINVITLLPAATAPGLQVLDLNGRWHDVPCDSGTIVVNAGDMLKLASGGYYPSTTHRVVNPSGPGAREPRYSMPLFLHPFRDVRLSETHTAGSYLDERLRQIGLKK